MSMDRCKDCGDLVDTDDEPECYYVEDESGNTIEEGECRCEGCREERQAILLTAQAAGVTS